MKKRVVSVLAAAGLAVSLLAGCGSSDSSTAEDTTSAAEEAADDTSSEAETAETDSDSGEVDYSLAEGKRVGITFPSLGSDYMTYLAEGVEETLAEYGVDAQIDSCDGDVTTQIEQIENYISMEMDAIVIFASNTDSVETVAQEAVDAGIPVISFAYEMQNATTSIVSTSEDQMGRDCAQMALDWIEENYADAGDGEVTVLAITGSLTPENATRCDAMVETLSENSKVTLIEAECENEMDQNTARTLTENQMSANSDIDVIVCVNSTCAIGADSYVLSSDSPVEDLSKFAIFGVDESDEADQKIIASANDESCLRGIISLGQVSDSVNDFMKGLMPALTDQEMVERIDGESYVLTADNIEEYLGE